MPSVVDGKSKSIHKIEIGKESSVFFGIYNNCRRPLSRNFNSCWNLILDLWDSCEESQIQIGKLVNQWIKPLNVAFSGFQNHEIFKKSCFLHSFRQCSLKFMVQVSIALPCHLLPESRSIQKFISPYSNKGIVENTQIHLLCTRTCLH